MVVLRPSITCSSRQSFPRCTGCKDLLGTTMAPAWRADIFELGTASQLIAGWPSVAERISRLCRR